jgi:Spore coat assembly protein
MPIEGGETIYYIYVMKNIFPFFSIKRILLFGALIISLDACSNSEMELDVTVSTEGLETSLADEKNDSSSSAPLSSSLEKEEDDSSSSAVSSSSSEEGDGSSSSAVSSSSSEEGDDSSSSVMSSSSEKILHPVLQTVSFSKNIDDPVKDVLCEIRKDSIVECFAKKVFEGDSLAADITFEGDSVLFSGERVSAEKAQIKLADKSDIVVYMNSEKKNYTVRFYPYTNLPYISVEVKDGSDIVNKKDYKDADVRVWNDEQNNYQLVKCQVKGRGNSTWMNPKKPYRLKCYNKFSPYSFPADKSWVLLANHYDKTMARNALAYYISSLSIAPYTPRTHFVELVLNGEHLGTYQIADKLQVDKNRVNIDKKDFLLEPDNHPSSSDISFTVEHLTRPVKIHNPDVAEGDEDYNYVKNAVQKIDSVLFSDNFLDPDEGYKKYVDLPSLVEWFVVTEIVKNPSNRSNWYMTYEREGKLKMGPFWDYDLAFANSLWLAEANLTEGFLMEIVPWFTQILKDPEFIQMAKERFNYFYSYKNDIIAYLDETVQQIRLSASINNEIWDVFEGQEFSSSYDGEVEFTKQWILDRFEWLKGAFQEL